jgi:hypothetical protein
MKKISSLVLLAGLFTLVLPLSSYAQTTIPLGGPVGGNTCLGGCKTTPTPSPTTGGLTIGGAGDLPVPPTPIGDGTGTIVGGCMTVTPGSTDIATLTNEVKCLSNEVTDLESRVRRLEIGISMSGSNTVGAPVSISSGLINGSTEVRAVQTFLKATGTLSATPTGYFGKLTQQAVKAYQTKEGLPVTGKVDSATLNMIQSQATQVAPSVAPQLQQITTSATNVPAQTTN